MHDIIIVSFKTYDIVIVALETLSRHHLSGIYMVLGAKLYMKS